MCINTNGSYNCKCYQGYLDRIGDGKSCTGKQTLAIICLNTMTELSSFKIKIDPSILVNINECKVSLFACSHLCMNINGSYKCKCNKGYFVYATGDDISCTSKVTLIIFSLVYK